MSYKAMDGTRQWDGSKKVPEERMAVKMQSFARTGNNAGHCRGRPVLCVKAANMTDGRQRD